MEDGEPEDDDHGFSGVVCGLGEQGWEKDKDNHRGTETEFLRVASGGERMLFPLDWMIDGKW